MKKFISTGGVYEDGYQKCTLPTTTNMTKNEFFEKNGYLSVPGLVQFPERIFCPPPTTEDGSRLTGRLNYIRKDKYQYFDKEKQVNGSLSRYNYPEYKQLFYLVRKQVEKRLGIDLLPTYFYERFYYAGQHLPRHCDRPACEISVTLQISTNSKKPWPIWFECPDGSEPYVAMKNGDACIYKGCEREHWRDSLESKYNNIEKFWRKRRGLEDDTYHHQIFLHYVNAQGPFVHFANDR